jgi:hypothetical protein
MFLALWLETYTAALRFPNVTDAYRSLSRPDMRKAPCGVSVCLGDVEEDVRAIFQRLDDTSIYIPTFN